MKLNRLMILTLLFKASMGSALFAQMGVPSRDNMIEQELLGPSMRDILNGNKETPPPFLEQSEEELIKFPDLEEVTKEELPKESSVEEDTKTKNEEKDLASWINEYCEFGGAIEVEAFWLKDFNGVKESDISLEAAELDFEITVTDWAVGVLSVEWEPEDETFLVKEAFVRFGDTECYPYFAVLGRLFVPFGIGTGAIVGDTLSVSDPLTIEIFEAQEEVAMFGYRWNGLYAAAYVYNGETNSGNGEDDHIEHYGATIRYGIDRTNFSFSAGIDYISSVFDSDNLSFVFPGALQARYAPGVALHTRYFNHGFHFIAEYNGAFRSSSFEVAINADEVENEEELIFEDITSQPSAWQIEIGYVTDICCHSTYFALNYSESYDLDGFFPRRRFLATVGRWIYEDQILLALEYGRDWDYSKSKGGTGKQADSVIFQMAYEW